MSEPGVDRLTHLLPEVSAVAALTQQERIDYIGQDRWLPYRKAEEVLALLEDLVNRPRVKRPTSLMLLARSGNGKSHILGRFSELHPGQPNIHGPHIIAPVMMIEVMPSARDKDLYKEILFLLNRPIPRGAAVDECRDAAVAILRTVQTKVLLIDEINNLLSGSVARQREFMFSLKYLSNLLQMSIVVAGTPESRQLVRLSDQLENRFQSVGLPIWSDIDELRVLLANFEQVLPLREPSGLSRRGTATLISSFGVDTIGAVSALLNACAIEAIKHGQERITEDILRRCAPLSRLEVRKQEAAL